MGALWATSVEEYDPQERERGTLLIEAGAERLWWRGGCKGDEWGRRRTRLM